jgi:hypothetical protein
MYDLPYSYDYTVLMSSKHINFTVYITYTNLTYMQWGQSVTSKSMVTNHIHVGSFDSYTKSRLYGQVMHKIYGYMILKTLVATMVISKR